ncbi:MAG: hypothetical protein AAGA03_14735 [Planctomycetota bacterium]
MCLLKHPGKPWLAYLVVVSSCIAAVGCHDRMVDPAADDQSALEPEFAVLRDAPTSTLDHFAMIYNLGNPNWSVHAESMAATGSPFVRRALEDLRERESRETTEESLVFPDVRFSIPPIPKPKQMVLIERLLAESTPIPLNGQRTVQLLELAAFADVTCHRIESPLLSSTLRCVASSSEQADVARSIEWISSSYECRFGDDLLRDAMDHRMREYARMLTQRENGRGYLP